MNNQNKNKIGIYCSGLVLSLVSSAALAHVKWFANTDASETPKPIGDVLTQPAFVQLFRLSVA